MKPRQQAIMETAFDIPYLAFAVIAGGMLLARPSEVARLFGAMALVLGLGDAFHLGPRMWGLWHGGLAAYARPLGLGKQITSITMTAFYVLLYYIWRAHYAVDGMAWATALLWALALLRAGLCLLPQNRWQTPPTPPRLAIGRNVPFAGMGVLLIALFWAKGTGMAADPLRAMPVAIALSFALYVPVVLLADRYPKVGMLMMPKTLAYVWILVMGLSLA